MPTNKFAIYRERLIKKGIIKSEAHSVVSLDLPRFDVFVSNMFDE